ncbi:MAG: hypothetical protein ABWX94_01595 [Candidatus Saccharimonadales bacterium]
MSEFTTVIPEQLPLAEAPESSNWLDQRVERAIDQCDFLPTPELEKGVEGFYKDHYTLASTMELCLSDDVEQSMAGNEQKQRLRDIIKTSYFKPDEINASFSSLIEYGGMSNNSYVQEITPLLARVRLARLENPQDSKLRRAELTALTKASEVLFAEASVGVSTLGGEEAEVVAGLHHAIGRQIEESGLFTRNQGSSNSWTAKDIGNRQLPQTLRGVTIVGNPLYFINRSIGTYWRDSRFAGQLLFHNTGHFQDVSKRGEIMPRRMQQQKYGETNTQTAAHLDNHIHSPTPHWSENFDPRSYRGEQGAEGGGTIALPISEIIKTAPYARDAYYGTLTVKPDEEKYVTAHVPVSNGVTSIGFGGADGQGAGGNDRTFYASPYDVPRSVSLEEAPDGYSILIDQAAYWVQLGVEDTAKVWEAGDPDQKPQPYLIPAKVYQGGRSLKDAEQIQAWRRQRDAMIGKAIKALQAESIAHYPNEVVVPLRAGIMDFYVPDDGAPDGKKRAEFTLLPGNRK